MKKIVLFLVATSLLSCESHQLNDSFILFSEAQPADVDEITHFPQKYIGEYSFDATHKIMIQSKYIIFLFNKQMRINTKNIGYNYAARAVSYILETACGCNHYKQCV